MVKDENWQTKITCIEIFTLDQNLLDLNFPVFEIKRMHNKSLSFYIAVTRYENAPDSQEYLFTQFNFYIIIEAGK